MGRTLIERALDGGDAVVDNVRKPKPSATYSGI
jgi:hypothetical protein